MQLDPIDFPETEPDTKRDVAALARAHSDPPPPSTWKPRPPMSSATYSIVPGRGACESGVAASEAAPAARPRTDPPAPPLDDVTRWRLDVAVGRIGRVTHYDLLEVAEDAPADVVKERYRASVARFEALSAADGPARRKIEILVSALTQAYEELATTERRRAYDAHLMDARTRGVMSPASSVKRR